MCYQLAGFAFDNHRTTLGIQFPVHLFVCKLAILAVIVVEPHILIAFCRNRAEVVGQLSLVASDGIADIHTPQIHSRIRGIVELYPSAVVERRVDKHIDIARLYLVDDKIVGRRRI